MGYVVANSRMGKFLAYPCHHVNAYHVAAVDFSKEFEYMGLNLIDVATMINLFFAPALRGKEGTGEILRNTDKILLCKGRLVWASLLI